MFSSDHRGTNVISSNQSRELAVNLHILYCWKILNQVLLWEMCAFSIWDVFDGAFENVGQITPLFTGKPKRNLGLRTANFPISVGEAMVMLLQNYLFWKFSTSFPFCYFQQNGFVLWTKTFFSSLLHSCQGCLRTTDGSRLDVS